jgi:hypothetical protein
MKQILIIMGILSFFGCGQKDQISQNEKELLNNIAFDTELVLIIKSKVNSQIEQLPAIDQETGDILDKKYDGIFMMVSEEMSVDIVKSFKNDFRSKGYLIFVMDTESGEKSIAIIKGHDDLEILKYRRTDGINHDLENDDIVAKVSDWKTKYGLIVIGCSRDWVQIEFDRLPANLEEFAEEVYQFCPDSVDQGVGDIESLKMAIEQMHGIWLWWD